MDNKKEINYEEKINECLENASEADFAESAGEQIYKGGDEYREDAEKWRAEYVAYLKNDLYEAVKRFLIKANSDNFETDDFISLLSATEGVMRALHDQCHHLTDSESHEIWESLTDLAQWRIPIAREIIDHTGSRKYSKKITSIGLDKDLYLASKDYDLNLSKLCSDAIRAEIINRRKYAEFVKSQEKSN